VQARFAGLAPMGRAARALASRPLPLLARVGLDPRTLRWHLVQSLRARRAIAAAVAAERPDVLHVHSQSVALTLGSLMRSTPTAVSVDTTVGDWYSMPAWRPRHRRTAALIAPSQALECRAFERAALVLAWTAWARRAVERAAPRARVIEHHPGIDLARYRPAPRRERTLPRVLFVGGRFAEKGGEDLLAALGEDLGRTVELDIVTPADVPTRPGLRVHRLDPSDPELLDLQQQADIFCLPSYGDAAPWAVLEAMACGTPVLGSDVGGIPDLLDDGHAGRIVAHGNRADLAEQLRALLSDGPLRAELATRARTRCEQVYDARRQFASLAGELANMSGSAHV
jgi:glycosyltransferase involved in cell wall biosynthesis